MNQIAGIPYVQAQFDKKGKPLNHVSIPEGVTDVFIISHGWNNNQTEAEDLYTELFTSFKNQSNRFDFTNRKCAIVGVIWPSKKFDALVAVDTGAGGGPAAAASKRSKGQQRVECELDQLKDLFPEKATAIDQAKKLLPKLESQATARRQFADKIRSLLDAKAASPEDASDRFFKKEGNALMERLKISEDDLAEDIIKGGGATSIPQKKRGNAHGGAAGLKDIFSGFMTAAMNILNYTTYYEMKTRAGTVGQNGVAPLVDEIAKTIASVHLIGHSFGGRLVTAAAAHSKTDRLKSMTLLQAAFSHNGFSKLMNGFFRKVVDAKRVNGPILITHTKNDSAVGIAYPLASRISGDNAAAFGDENDEYGGIGRNGAQKMQPGEVTAQNLEDTTGAYQFLPGRFFNLKADKFISSHGDVRSKQVAYAILCAVAKIKN